MRILALTLLAAACGSPSSIPIAAEPDPVAPVPAPEPPRPAPGLDLAGPIAPPAPATPVPRAPAVPLDLLADRAVVKVDAPRPPRGGAVGFTFGDDRRGWVARIPDSRQLPSVTYAHDKVFVSGGFESVSFYALSATTGELAWATTNLEDNGPTSAVIEDDTVLFNTESCTLFALDVKTGQRRWYRYLGDPTLAQIAVVDGLVYSAYPGQDGKQYLGAFRVKTGVPVWARYVGTEVLATPVIAGDSVYVSTTAGLTFRFDHRTGKQRWAKPLRATTAPWILGEELFVTRRRGKHEQQIVVSTETGAILREHRLSAGAYVADVPADSSDWKALWQFEGSRPVVDRGIHYVAMGNEVIASDAATGEALWHRRYPVAANKRSLGSVALAGSALVVSSRDGKVFGLDVDTGYTLWSYDLGTTVIAEPIIARGWLYAATADGHVIALDVGDPSLDGWHNFGGNAQKNGLVPPPPEAPRRAEATPPADAPVTPDDAIAAAQDRLAAEAQAQARLEAERQRALAEETARREARRRPFVIDDECLTTSLCLR